MKDVLLFTIDWLNRSVTDRLIASLQELDATLLILINDNEPIEYQALPEDARLRLETCQMGHNLGFSQACNIAVSIAADRGLPFLMHINNDIRLTDPKQITHFVEEFASNPRLAAASPAVIRDNGQVEFAGSSPLARISSAIIHSQRNTQLQGKSTRDSVFFDGACFIARITALQQSGGFCPDFFAYREEHDLAYRLRRGGWQIAYIDRLQVQHATSASASRYPRFMAFLMLRGQFLFMRRNLGILRALWYLSILGVKILIGATLKVVRGDREGLTGMRLALLNQLFSRVIEFEIRGSHLTFHDKDVELNGKHLADWVAQHV